MINICSYKKERNITMKHKIDSSKQDYINQIEEIIAELDHCQLKKLCSIVIGMNKIHKVL